MDYTIDQRLELLEWAVWELQTRQLTATTSGTQNSLFELFYSQSGTDLSVPIQSSLTLPEGLKAENNSWSTYITTIEKPDYTIDDDSFTMINWLFFDFLSAVAWILFFALFVYYIRSFLFYFLFPKKDGF